MNRGCAPLTVDEGVVCRVHGAAWSETGCLATSVADDVLAHRQWQFEQYGANRDVPDGTGKDVEWLAPVVSEAATRGFRRGHDYTATGILDLFREEWDYDNSATEEEKAQFYKDMTWVRMLREEVAEAFIEDDPEALEVELIQVAALAISWVEKLRERRAYQYGVRVDGGVFTTVGWNCVADVMAAQHGLGAPRGSQVHVVRRHVGEDWEDIS